MRRLLYLAVVTTALLLSQGTEVITARYRTSAAGVTISNIQRVSPTSSVCVSATCTITVASTTAGNLGVVLATTGDHTTYISSVSGGGTWTANGACAAASTVQDGMSDIAYNLNLTGGATTITVTASSNYPGYVAYAEYHGGTWTLDGACASAANVAASLTASSPPVTTTGAKDLIVTAIDIDYQHYSTQTVTGTGWTNPFDIFLPGPAFSNTNGVGNDALNVSAGTYQMSVTQNSSMGYSSSALAFQSN